MKKSTITEQSVPASPLSPVSEQDKGDVFRSAADNAVLIDCELGIIASGAQVRRAIGSIRTYRELTGFMPPSDAFRLEQFIIRNTPYSQISTLEVTLRGAGRFKFAAACRQNVFGKSAVVLEFYADKRARLLSDKVYKSNLCASPLSGELNENIEKAKQILALFERSHPDEANALRQIMSSFVRKSLASTLIASITDPGKDTRASFDAAELVNTAANYVKNALAGANVETVYSSTDGKMSPVSPGISPEHMWHLVTCALTSVIGISKHGKSVIGLDRSFDALKMTFSTQCASFVGQMPREMTLGELREILAPSTLRLYLCELICEEHDILSAVSCVDERLEISFEFKLKRHGRKFHRFDTTAKLLPQLWSVVTNVLVIPDGEN